MDKDKIHYYALHEEQIPAELLTRLRLKYGILFGIISAIVGGLIGAGLGAAIGLFFSSVGTLATWTMGILALLAFLAGGFFGMCAVIDLVDGCTCPKCDHSWVVDQGPFGPSGSRKACDFWWTCPKCGFKARGWN